MIDRLSKMISDQRGGASLLAVAVTGAIISVLVISLTRLMTGELRHATDLANGIRSYYGAESGAELTTLFVKNYTRSGKNLKSLNQGCAPATGQGEGVDLTDAVDPYLNINNIAAGLGGDLPDISCVTITAINSLQPIKVKKNQTVEFDLTGLNYDRIEVFWGGQTPGGTPSRTGEETDPKIETTLTNFNYTGDDPSTTSIGGAVLDPTNHCGPSSDSACAPASLFYIAYPPSNDPLNDPDPSRLRPQVQRLGAQYGAASFSLPNLAKIAAPTDADLAVSGLSKPFNSVLRLTSRDGDSLILVRVYSGDREVTAIPLQSAQVDVTARVGAAFRRVAFDVPIKASPLDSANVLYADVDICKDQEVISIPASVGGSAYEQAFQNICPIQ